MHKAELGTNATTNPQRLEGTGDIAMPFPGLRRKRGDWTGDRVLVQHLATCIQKESYEEYGLSHSSHLQLHLQCEEGLEGANLLAAQLERKALRLREGVYIWLSSIPERGPVVASLPFETQLRGKCRSKTLLRWFSDRL